MMWIYCERCSHQFREFEQESAPGRGMYAKAIFGTMEERGMRCERCDRTTPVGAPACCVTVFEEGGEPEIGYLSREKPFEVLYKGGRQPQSRVQQAHGVVAEDGGRLHVHVSSMSEPTLAVIPDRQGGFWRSGLSLALTCMSLTLIGIPVLFREGLSRWEVGILIGAAVFCSILAFATYFSSSRSIWSCKLHG